jgi:hypothetical protein
LAVDVFRVSPDRQILHPRLPTIFYALMELGLILRIEQQAQALDELLLPLPCELNAKFPGFWLVGKHLARSPKKKRRRDGLLARM